MPLSEAAILAWEQKQKIFEMPPSLILIFMLQASFVPILKPLPHLAQFLHVSAALFIGQLYSYCPEAPNGRVKYVAHRASCLQ